MPTFSERFKELRKQRKITQKQLAEELGIATSTLIKYEHGEREPSIPNIKKFAQYFGVSTDYLLGYDEDFSKLDLLSKQLTLDAENKAYIGENGEWVYTDTASKKLLQIILSERAAAYRKSITAIAIRHGIIAVHDLPNLSNDKISQLLEGNRKTLSKEEQNARTDELLDELERNKFFMLKR